MDPKDAQRIAQDERYRSLVRRRGRLTVTLTLAMLFVYFGFVLLVAFAGEWLGQPIGAGVTSIGILLGFGVILFAILLTGIYVRRAARDFDPLVAALRSEGE